MPLTSNSYCMQSHTSALFSSDSNFQVTFPLHFMMQHTSCNGVIFVIGNENEMHC